MEKQTAAFEFIYNLSLITVEQLPGEVSPAYKVSFSNEVPALVICKLEKEGETCWDTVPPGNTELAAGIGKLIEERNAGIE